MATEVCSNKLSSSVGRFEGRQDLPQSKSGADFLGRLAQRCRGPEGWPSAITVAAAFER